MDLRILNQMKKNKESKSTNTPTREERDKKLQAKGWRKVKSRFKSIEIVGTGKPKEGKYLNEFHKESAERKMKKIAEYKKNPASLEEVLKSQRMREQQTKENEDS